MPIFIFEINQNNKIEMKKVLIGISFLTFISTFSIYAQKSKNKKSLEKPIELVSSIDSISYAFGAGVTNQGLNQYLMQLGVIADTSNVTDPSKLDSINTANAQNIIELLQGANDRLYSAEKSTAYNTGFEIGSQIEKMAEGLSKQIDPENSDPINLKVALVGINDALTKQSMRVENPEQYIESIMQVSQDKAKLAAEAANASIIAEGEAFMAANAQRPGVVSLPSGLQYEVEVEGTGAIPTATDKVKVHYTGTLLDGTVFDSSVQRGTPISFGVQQVIKGWTEALQLMPVGSKWKVYIPYDLAYGDRDTGSIKPYSNLIFEIELLDIE